MQTHPDRFMTVLLESILSKHLTLENEYAALRFSIDRLRHPLLRRVSCVLKPGSNNFVISVTEFKTLRLPIINCKNYALHFMFLSDSAIAIFSALTEALRSNRHENRNQQFISYIFSMLSTMKDIYQVRSVIYCELQH